jgi:hypothetical protein
MSRHINLASLLTARVGQTYATTSAGRPPPPTVTIEAIRQAMAKLPPGPPGTQYTPSRPYRITKADFLEIQRKLGVQSQHRDDMLRGGFASTLFGIPFQIVD